MSDINSIGSPATATTLREFAKQSSKASPQNSVSNLADRVEISELASFLSRLAELPEDRARKIVDIRNALQNGSYESDEKLEIATERLLDEFSPR
ncbi:MAG: flagellar biosynthesis anti-sigma factor FlgM [Phycisphaerales bacterium]|nr:flagellar biosynthesis anti-sigma factor FlgM [Phycisphaerales bacterium]